MPGSSMNVDKTDTTKAAPSPNPSKDAEKAVGSDPNANIVNTRKIMTAEQIRRKAESVIENESEDTSVLLRVDSAPLKEVNDSLWWSYDFACALIATYFSHPAHSPAGGEPSLTILERLVAVTYILAVGFVLQQLYFKSGLDRPASGQMQIDKAWHMAIVHFGNCLFFWEWSVGVYNQYVFWRDNNTSLVTVVFTIALWGYATIFLCDIIAGLVHWFGDTMELYFFTYHHEDSRYMTRQSYVHHTWETFALAIFLSYTIAPVLRTTLVGMSIRVIASQANECHMWAHCTSKEIPVFIKLLQRLRLVLDWRAHNTHHKAPFLKDYCVFNGWANPLMNKILPGPLTNGLVSLRNTKAFHWLRNTLDS